MPKRLRVFLARPERGEQLLPEAESRYVARVHRLRPGAEVVVFDPEAAREATAIVLEVGKRVRVDVSETRGASRLGFPGLSLYVAQPKGGAADQVLRDAVALGVGRLVWLQSERSTPRQDAARRSSQHARGRALALDAARQCHRGDLPSVVGPSAWAEQFGRWPDGVHCVLDPGGEVGLAEWMKAESPEVHRAPGLHLWIGPEGGFSDAELNRLEQNGVRRVRLGPWVLRVPTAVAAALGAVLAETCGSSSSDGDLLS